MNIEFDQFIDYEVYSSLGYGLSKTIEAFGLLILLVTASDNIHPFTLNDSLQHTTNMFSVAKVLIIFYSFPEYILNYPQMTLTPSYV